MSEKETDFLFKEADKAWDSGDFRQAFKLFSRAAELGDVSCLINLGYFYDLGLGVRKNKMKALQLYKKAARKGDVCAASNVGTVYRDIGNFARAQFWFLKAFEQGDGDAALLLAKLYLQRNLKKDKGYALKYLRLSIKSKFITECSVEEAKSLLKNLEEQDLDADMDVIF